MATQYLDSPIGTLMMMSDGKKMMRIAITKKEGKNEPDALTQQCAAELKRFFAGTVESFSVPIAVEGTSFQKSVWNAMRKIPYGHTKTYAEIARKIGKPKAVRAVGSACGKNPLLVLVPCHRVIGSNRTLGGFSAGISAKKLLLAYEKNEEILLDTCA